VAGLEAQHRRAHGDPRLWRSPGHKGYNELYGGVRCYTYISRRVELAHIWRDAAGGGEPRGASHGKEATAAGAHST